MIRKMFVLFLTLCFAYSVALADTLVLGGQNGNPGSSTFEKYDDSGHLLLTGNLDDPRSDFSATQYKASGDIFVAGGDEDPTSWEILDESGNVLHSGLLNDERNSHGATLLTNGNVFLAGGNDTPDTWEIHGPTGTLVAHGNLQDSRSGDSEW